MFSPLGFNIVVAIVFILSLVKNMRNCLCCFVPTVAVISGGLNGLVLASISLAYSSAQELACGSTSDMEVQTLCVNFKKGFQLMFAGSILIVLYSFFAIILPYAAFCQPDPDKQHYAQLPTGNEAFLAPTGYPPNATSVNTGYGYAPNGGAGYPPNSGYPPQYYPNNQVYPNN